MKDGEVKYDDHAQYFDICDGEEVVGHGGGLDDDSKNLGSVGPEFSEGLPPGRSEKVLQAPESLCTKRGTLSQRLLASWRKAREKKGLPF